jgi:Ca2+-transporting ATPase
MMAVGTLFVLDYSLPGGLIEGSGDLPYARTMALTTLMLFQLFNVPNARSDDRSAFHDFFTNPWLWGPSRSRCCCSSSWSTHRLCSRPSEP